MGPSGRSSERDGEIERSNDANEQRFVVWEGRNWADRASNADRQDSYTNTVDGANNLHFPTLELGSLPRNAPRIPPCSGHCRYCLFKIFEFICVVVNLRGGRVFYYPPSRPRVSIAAADFKEAHLLLVGCFQKLSKRFVNRREGDKTSDLVISI